MHSFRNDYSEECHSLVLEALAKFASEQQPGYTEDAHCERARMLLRETMLRSLERSGAQDGHRERVRDSVIEFVSGGTMANLLTISSALRPYECVIAAPEGHINVHETGAIEATGHKVLTTSDMNGLLSVEGVDAVMAEHGYGQDHHMVMPRMLYFSFSTEMGMVHSAAQLAALRAYADTHDLLIYIDGARLAAGLASPGTDATLADILKTADAFTFGGTKNGELFGEAVVLLDPAAFGSFKAAQKQRGALMAKGFLYGIQFEALFDQYGCEAGIPGSEEDEPLYFSLGRHANAMAAALEDALKRNGFTHLVSQGQTNQVFVRVDADTARLLAERFGCEFFGVPCEGEQIVRFVCSWATEPEHIEELDRTLRSLHSR